MTPAELFSLTTNAIETLLSNLTLPGRVTNIGPIPVDPSIEGAKWRADMQIDAGMEWFSTVLTSFTDPTFFDYDSHYYECRPLGFGGKVYDGETYIGFGLSIEISY